MDDDGRVQCQICAGAGGWDRVTGQPMGRGSEGNEWRSTCPYCNGEGRTKPVPQEGAFRG